MTNGRRNGADAERELAARIAALTGVRLVRRLDQVRAGGHDLEPDVGDTSDAAAALRRLALEVKRRRAITDADVARWWTEEAVPQARAAGLLPALATRADRAPWRLVLPLALFSEALPEVPATFALEALPELLEHVGAEAAHEPRPAARAATIDGAADHDPGSRPP